MSRSLESVIEEIAENEEMSRKFIAMDEIDEIYEYCKNMGLGSSEEEFDEEVSSMIDNFYIYSSQIDKNDLSLVAGGSSLNKHFNKAVASALSALVLTGAGAANSNIAAGVSTPPKSVATSASADTKTANKKYVAKNGANAESDSKFSKTVESIKEFFRKHKLGTGITAAAILMLVYAGFAYHNGDARFWKWGRKVERDSQNTQNSYASMRKEKLKKLEKELEKAKSMQKERLRNKMVDNGYVPPNSDKGGESSGETTGNKKLENVFDEMLPRVRVEYDPFHNRSTYMSFEELNEEKEKQIIRELNADLIREQNGEDLTSKVDEHKQRISKLSDEGKKYVNGFLSGKYERYDRLSEERAQRPLYFALS